MVGITSIGTYIPIYRLNRDEIAKMWGGRSAGGAKAVAGYDEDTITMAVAATLDCMKGNKGEVNGLSLATTTSPYREKQAAAMVASAADIANQCYTADYTSTLRAASTALKSAIDAVNSGAADSVIVTAADSRLGAAKGNFELTLGDGAAALMIGSKGVIANIEGSYSLYSDFIDLWRTNEDNFIRTAEGRFIDEVGYMPIMREVISGVMKKCSIEPGGISKAVYYASDARQHAGLGRRLGFDKAQIQDPLYNDIGNTGTAAPILMLIAALETASPGDKILFASYGDGADAYVFSITEDIKKIQGKIKMADKLKGKTAVSYGQYLTWRELLPVEASTLPDRSPLSLANRWRERKAITALYGVKCKVCGTPQFHMLGQAIRICVHCQSKDQFEDYKFADKIGKVFSYAIDQLQSTKNPPGVNGVVDFDEGGRLICELTDTNIDEMKVGMPVEMTYRLMFINKGIRNYFWKAKPVSD